MNLGLVQRFVRTAETCRTEYEAAQHGFRSAHLRNDVPVMEKKSEAALTALRDYFDNIMLAVEASRGG